MINLLKDVETTYRPWLDEYKGKINSKFAQIEILGLESLAYSKVSEKFNTILILEDSEQVLFNINIHYYGRDKINWIFNDLPNDYFNEDERKLIQEYIYFRTTINEITGDIDLKFGLRDGLSTNLVDKFSEVDNVIEDTIRKVFNQIYDNLYTSFKGFLESKQNYFKTIEENLPNRIKCYQEFIAYMGYNYSNHSHIERRGFLDYLKAVINDIYRNITQKNGLVTPSGSIQSYNEKFDDIIIYGNIPINLPHKLYYLVDNVKQDMITLSELMDYLMVNDASDDLNKAYSLFEFEGSYINQQFTNKLKQENFKEFNRLFLLLQQYMQILKKKEENINFQINF